MAVEPLCAIIGLGWGGPPLNASIQNVRWFFNDSNGFTDGSF
jgi:hypothetical protein